ncbi:MAG: glycosyltransferase family 4 protein [Gemmatimonadota bacterium]|nr:glycosyltransferase family 4 protein [Gemmatimonadota bacterium]
MQIRTYNVLRLLSRDFDVTALCFYRAVEFNSTEEVRRSVEGLRHLARVEAFPIPQERSKLRLISDHLRSILTGRVYTLFAYESEQFRQRLGELVETQPFKLVHMDSMDLAGYLPKLAGLPVICVHHNVESALLRRRAATTRGLAARYMTLQARFSEKEERRWCPAFTLNVAVSDEDRDAFRRIAPVAPFIVVPNGVDTKIFRPGTGPEEGIVFVGAHSWQPNRDAMERFCLEVLPRIRAGGIKARVVWIGRASEALKREYAVRFGVELTGYVSDIRPLVQGAACYVAPLRSGGGTRLKILDAWAMGKAVVSTTVGCEGLAARDGENILIRDTPERFADAVGQVLTDENLRRRLGNHARKTAEVLYDWEVIGQPMLAHYHQLRTLAENSRNGDDTRRQQPESRLVGKKSRL